MWVNTYFWHPARRTELPDTFTLVADWQYWPDAYDVLATELTTLGTSALVYYVEPLLDIGGNLQQQTLDYNPPAEEYEFGPEIFNGARTISDPMVGNFDLFNLPQNIYEEEILNNFYASNALVF